jgi:DNA helicase-2/ATP-dependent DNA helicase PcrA
VAIRCGHCGATHDTAGDVRRCHEGSLAETLASARPEVLSPRVHRIGTDSVHTDSLPGGAGRRSFAGPDALGRNVLVNADGEPPEPWRDAARIEIDERVLADPAPLVAVLRERAAARQRTVFELRVPFDDPDEIERRPLHELGPGFELQGQALHHLVWANSVDARSPDGPCWTLADRAVALGAEPGGPADVVLPSGAPAWCDGGPLWHPDDSDTSAPNRYRIGAHVLHRISLEHGSLAPLGVNVTSADLADDQLAAVTHPGGGARVIAPAGSGKTRVLTERARILLGAWDLPPDAVCLVAFNKRAQEEMRDRTVDVARLHVRTLNSLALAIVNGDKPFATRPQRRRTIDEPQVRRILSELVKFPRRTNTDPAASWIEALSVARLGLRAPLDVEHADGDEIPGFADVLARYRDRLARDGTLDFDEQIVAAIEILLTEPAARRQAQRACRLLLVDEFQDLTPAHLLLVRLLASPDLAVFGVGDDDQTIYGYNGADPTWLIDYGKYFPGAGDHPLEVNYRCAPAIVTAADRLLRHNRRRVPKTIRAGRQDGTGWRSIASKATADATVGVVSDLVASGTAPADIAVLARVNVVLAPVQIGLMERGVAVRPAIGTEFLDRVAVRSALAWLRLATGRWTTDAVREALRRPSRSLHPRIAEWTAEQRDIAGLRRLAVRVTNERDSERLAEFAVDIAAVSNHAASTTVDALGFLCDRIGLAGAISTLDRDRHGMNRTAQADDLDALMALAPHHPDARSFETWLNEALKRRGEPDGVTLASVHKVKGQEWRHVVIHHADALQFPHRLADDREEERRVFHVALTRAIDEAVIVTTTTPTMFLAELTTEPGDLDDEPLELPAPPPPRAAKTAATTDEPLVAALRAFRQTARNGKPAYTVFDDDTMHRIATLRPTTLAQLATVRGIGKARLDNFGAGILEAVAAVEHD